MSGYPWRDMAADERRRAASCASCPPGSAERQRHLERAAGWDALADIEQNLTEDNDDPEGTER